MSHRSRICAVLVDTSATTHEPVSRFWSAALGRKLDYSAPERYASLKGLCSKADDLALTNLGIELKAAIEQLREQAQNIE